MFFFKKLIQSYYSEMRPFTIGLMKHWDRLQY